MKKTLIINDLHIPYHDPAAVGCALVFADWFRPDHIIVAGDLLDCEEISFFVNVNRPGLLLAEIARGMYFLQDLRSITDAPITLLEGNHERRFNLYIAKNARALQGLDGLSLPEQLQLRSLDIKWVPMVGRTSCLNLGPALVGHFNRVMKFSAYTAKNLVADYMTNVIQAHTHRLGEYHVTTPQGPVKGIESGCLCRLDPAYMAYPNWQQGFGVLIEDGDQFSLETVQIKDGVAFYGGEKFQGEY